MTLPQLPPEEDLRSLTAFLLNHGYAINQYIPFKEHGELFRKRHLHLLLQEDLKNIDSFNNTPILYNHTFSIDYFKNLTGMTREQETCRAVFLENRDYRVEELSFLPPELVHVVRQNSEEVARGIFRFQFRIIPVGTHIVLADRMDSAHEETVFLYRDSLLLFDHIGRRCRWEGKAVADIGSGSGVLSLAALAAGAREVRAFDVNSRSEPFIRMNCRLNTVATDRIRFVHDSYTVFDFNSDAVVSNPPYMYLAEGGRLSDDGGNLFGLEIAVDICRRCLDAQVELVMVLASPIREGESFFFSQVDMGREHARVIENYPLMSGVGSHDFLLEQGFTSRELVVLHWKP